MATYYRYDKDGWYKDTKEADEQPKDSTTINPNAVEGGGGMRFVDGAWICYCEYDDQSVMLRKSCDMKWNILDNGISLMQEGVTTITVNSDYQSRDTLRRLASDFGQDETISDPIEIKDYYNNFHTITAGNFFIDANNAVNGINGLEQELFRTEAVLFAMINNEECDSSKDACTYIKSNVLTYLQTRYNLGLMIACPLCMESMITV